MARYGMEYDRDQRNRSMGYDQDFGGRGVWSSGPRDWDRERDRGSGYGSRGMWGGSRDEMDRGGSGMGRDREEPARGGWYGINHGWNGMDPGWHDVDRGRRPMGRGMGPDDTDRGGGWNAMYRGDGWDDLGRGGDRYEPGRGRQGMDRGWRGGDSRDRGWSHDEDGDWSDRIRSGWDRMRSNMRDMMGGGYDRGW